MSDPARLATLGTAIGLTVDPAAAGRVCTYLDAMLEENRRVNLTGVRDPEQALVLHALDSLAIALAGVEPPSQAFDLGTGNGFPGVVLRELWPTARVVLCDRTRKKLDAIDRALAIAGIDADTLWVDVAQARANAPDFIGACDLVTARAVGEPGTVSALARPLLRRGGQLALWLSSEAEAPDQLAGAMTRTEVIEYDLPEPAPRRRKLALYVR